jgi:hypothetical protein
VAARAFETVIRLKLQQFSPEEAKKRHVAIARAGLAEFVAKQGTPPEVVLFTDGHAASTEEEVQPFGVIVYRFSRMREIAEFALQEAKRISPVLTGRYRDSWFAMVDNREVALDAIPPHATVVITNDQPYSRKINTGAKGFEKYVPPGIAEKVRQLVLSKYRNLITANVQYITLEGGYVLQHDLRKVVNGRRYGGPRADALAGSQISYPAIAISPKFLGG